MGREGYQSLQTFQGIAQVDPSEDFGEWNGKQSVRTFHIFVNQTEEPVDLVWFYEGSENYSGTILPGSNLYVGSYTFHQWKVKRQRDGCIVGIYEGNSATVTVRPGGCTYAFHTGTADDQGSAKASRMDTPHGGYAVRAHAAGMPVWAFDCVCDDAVWCAVHVASRVLEGVPPSVLGRMREQGAALGIFGRHHVVTDLPPHAFMRHTTNRDIDTTSRGLGGTPTVPVTSCGEENLTMEDDRFYPCQSILVHELGHAVMNLGMTDATRARLQAAYEAAVRDGLYPPGCYMVLNDHEYFATGTEAWFASTIRTDVNGGVRTREDVTARDPRLATVLAEMFGDTPWRYHHDCPKPLSFYRPPSKDKGSSSSGNKGNTSKAELGAGTEPASTPTPGSASVAANSTETGGAHEVVGVVPSTSPSANAGASVNRNDSGNDVTQGAAVCERSPQGCESEGSSNRRGSAATLDTDRTSPVSTLMSSFDNDSHAGSSSCRDTCDSLLHGQQQQTLRHAGSVSHPAAQAKPSTPHSHPDRLPPTAPTPVSRSHTAPSPSQSAIGDMRRRSSNAASSPLSSSSTATLAVLGQAVGKAAAGQQDSGGQDLGGDKPQAVTAGAPAGVHAPAIVMGRDSCDGCDSSHARQGEEGCGYGPDSLLWGCSVGSCVSLVTGVAGPLCPGLLSACLLGRGRKAKE